MKTNNNIDISIVVPLYNEEESLPELTVWIRRVMLANKFTYEILLIDDGSKDRSWQVIEELSQTHLEIKGIKFRRNYGKSAALNEGFSVASGNVIITMDADMQDSPDEIPDLYRMIIEENYDLVSGWKKKRYDPLSKTIPTKLFNAVTRSISDIKLNDFNCGLKAYKNTVVKNIEIYGEMHRYIPVIAKWAGFRKIGEKVVQHRERQYGITKFGWDRFINGFLDLASITFVSKFSKRPMHFFGLYGVIFFVIGSFLAIYLIVEKVIYSYMKIPVRDVTDKPHFYLALVAILIGVQLFLAGFISELISRISPDRNNYNIEKTIHLT